MSPTSACYLVCRVKMPLHRVASYEKRRASYDHQGGPTSDTQLAHIALILKLDYGVFLIKSVSAYAGPLLG